MLTIEQQEEIAQAATSTMVKVIEAFPTYLQECDPEDAARIIALLLKVQFGIPKIMPPEKTLADIVAEVARNAEEQELNSTLNS
ncbi:MAG TPA: hypothetical protein PLU88_01465 [Armatimonadota bacterium]|jgi:hypothetical protein|nr:hypothetical protein [Armatimonadota bacterium]HPP73779.1 hypothetical protein [Armatimonadota bacterium]